MPRQADTMSHHVTLTGAPAGNPARGQVAGPVRGPPRRAALRLAGAAAVLALGGCNSFIPASGPRLLDVEAGARTQSGNPGPIENPALGYTLITLDPDNVARLAAEPTGTRFSDRAAGARETDIRIGVGDIIGTTIFEAQRGGLFIPTEPGARPGNFVQLPSQQVNREGTITVPFGGVVRAIGLTPSQLERTIAERISTRALEPQVIVTIIERRSNAVSVTGDVTTSVRFGMDPGGERLLSAIARAGGPRFPAYESMVTLQRAGVSERSLMADVLLDPRQNVQLRQGDSVIVTREPRYFLALGAVGQSASITQLNRRFPFEDRQLSLADAVARAGGLQDDRANPSAVFLFRYERAATLQRIGVRPVGEVMEDVPTVYRADFTNPTTLFLTQRFPMRNNDLIFVSNSPFTDYQKFIAIVLPFTQAGAQARAIGG